MSRREGTSNGLSSLLGTGVECEGTARVEGTLRLDGAFRGRLEVGETLIIGQAGSFSGTACGRSVVIGGRFKGEVLGTEQVELQKGARLEGDVLTRSFVIEPGVFFEGSCRMEFTQADEARLRVGSGERGPEELVPETRDESVVRSLKKESESARNL
ncbi:MAG TPA: polymer-forming cytoskeletal protein [Gemmatimonadota bacterium]|nr:polymer-forming cytoskeletal protein [Gemmatimonadota bacterium]